MLSKLCNSTYVSIHRKPPALRHLPPVLSKPPIPRWTNSKLAWNSKHSIRATLLPRASEQWSVCSAHGSSCDSMVPMTKTISGDSLTPTKSTRMAIVKRRAECCSHRWVFAWTRAVGRHIWRRFWKTHILRPSQYFSPNHRRRRTICLRWVSFRNLDWLLFLICIYIFRSVKNSKRSTRRTLIWSAAQRSMRSKTTKFMSLSTAGVVPLTTGRGTIRVTSSPLAGAPEAVIRCSLRDKRTKWKAMHIGPSRVGRRAAITAIMLPRRTPWRRPLQWLRIFITAAKVDRLSIVRGCPRWWRRKLCRNWPSCACRRLYPPAMIRRKSHRCSLSWLVRFTLWLLLVRISPWVVHNVLAFTLLLNGLFTL